MAGGEGTGTDLLQAETLRNDEAEDTDWTGEAGFTAAEASRGEAPSPS